ncbi:hypothetical protein RUESEDTHA_03764 [Ruegeria sp. THAF57]|nr:hypothetical protein RUESEDTHA_03764 [Ruegeria sp. THAF57]
MYPFATHYLLNPGILNTVAQGNAEFLIQLHHDKGRT